MKVFAVDSICEDIFIPFMEQCRTEPVYRPKLFGFIFLVRP